MAIYRKVVHHGDRLLFKVMHVCDLNLSRTFKNDNDDFKTYQIIRLLYMHSLFHETCNFIFLTKFCISRSLKYSPEHQLDAIEQLMLGTKKYSFKFMNCSHYFLLDFKIFWPILRDWAISTAWCMSEDLLVMLLI